MRCQRIVKTQQTATCCVIIADPAKEEEIFGGAPSFFQFLNNDLCERLGASVVVRNNRGSPAAWQIDVDAPDARCPAQIIQRIRVTNARKEEKFHLLSQQGFRHTQLVIRIAMGADDDRAQAVDAGFRFKGFGQSGEEAIAVMWQDHSSESGSGKPQSSCLEVDSIAKPLSPIEDGRCGFRLDPVLLPRAIEDETDRCRGQLCRHRDVINR
ncbi:hypothetical protein X758_02100 [Mesorhizobium sp. LSHC416B00]|nr:hypothetical protein X761_01685 [Mesorhizobium sp. LSHC424B00]ESX76508.1 hypothetical protein X758_02100 [Mesorhizobium sp. LSHC416B00]